MKNKSHLTGVGAKYPTYGHNCFILSESKTYIGGKIDWNYSTRFLFLFSVLFEGSTDEWYKYSINYRQ